LGEDVVDCVGEGEEQVGERCCTAEWGGVVIDLKRVMMWVMFSTRERLIVTRMEVLLVVGGEIVARRKDVVSESSDSSESLKFSESVSIDE
jgi:hypothetical protein